MFLYTVHLQCYYLDTTPLKIPISIYHIKKTREKRNIRSLLNRLYIYTCIYEYSQCEGLHPLPPSPFLSLSLIWCHSLLCRHIFALSPLGCAKMQSYKGENAKLQLQRISILVSLLCISPSHLCTFAPSSSQLGTFSFKTSYSCIFTIQEKVRLALSEHHTILKNKIFCFYIG